MLMHRQNYFSSAYNNPYQQTAFSGNLPVNSFSPVTQAHSYRFQPMTSGTANVNNIGNLQGYPRYSNALAQSVNNCNPGLQYTQSVNPSSQGFATNFNNTGAVSWNTGVRSDFGIKEPSIDISETKNDIVLACDLPNVNLDDLNLTVSENTCTISAQSWTSGQNTALHRTVPLSTSVRSDAVDANYSNGILQVRMPKKDVTSKRDIKVNFK